MKRKIALFLTLSVLCAALAGCGKMNEETLPVFTAPETTAAAVPLEAEGPPVFDYEPGSMGIYVMADPNIEAAPEVLDSITMTLTDGKQEVRRNRVSDRQFDIVSKGHQVGGFVLVDIPREMLEKAPDSWDDFKAAVDHIAKQVMPGIYPAKAQISGGGGPLLSYDLPAYMVFSIEADDGTQYYHMIYIGETYIYDFWHDTCWFADGGETMRTTLSAEDIKPTLNQHEAWSIHDFPDNPWASQG